MTNVEMQKSGMVFEVGIASQTDLKKIMKISEENLGRNLTEDQRKEGGFTTAEFNERFLEEVITEGGIVVVRIDNELAAYVIPLAMEQADQIDFFKPLLQQIRSLTYKGKSFGDYRHCIIAQAAVDTKFRGLDVPKKLFSELINCCKKDYDCGIGEINVENT